MCCSAGMICRFNEIWKSLEQVRKKKVANIERFTPEIRSRARAHTRVAEFQKKTSRLILDDTPRK